MAIALQVRGKTSRIGFGPIPEHMGEPTTRLYQSWKRYAEQAGDSAGTQKAFRDNVRRHGFEYRPHLPDAHNSRGFIRISLKLPAAGFQHYAN